MEATAYKQANPATEKESTTDSHSPLHEYSHRGKRAMQARISELDKEWDVDRTLLLNGAAIALTGAILGAFVNKKWFLLTAAASFMLVEEAVTGWSPASAVMKKLGKRTREDIAREKYGLKALKGDFKDTANVSKIWDSTE